MRRTAWLVLSPWLVVAAVSVVAWSTARVFRELLTTEGGGFGNVGGELFAFIAGVLVWCGGSAALLRVIAHRAFPASLARGVIRWGVVAVVVTASSVGIATGPLEGGGLPLVWKLMPVFLPAAGTGAFLMAERRLTGRVVPRRDGWRRGALAAALGLTGALVGATAGVVVDVAALGPSERELVTAARGLVPPGHVVDGPLPVEGTLMANGYEASSLSYDVPTPDAGDVEQAANALGWRTDDVERSPGTTTLVLSLGDIAATVSMSKDGEGPPYSVKVQRGPMDARGALAGGLLGAGVGVVGVLVRRRP